MEQLRQGGEARLQRWRQGGEGRAGPLTGSARQMERPEICRCKFYLIGLLLWFFKYTSAKCENVPIICAFFSSSKLSPSEEWPALQVVMVDEVDKNYTAPKWVPIWGPGSPKGPHFFQGPHFLHFRLKNALKVRAATIY